MEIVKNFKRYRTRLALLLAVIGPGIVTANVDNDAGGIATYSVAGAHYGNGLLWMMPLVAVLLIVIQEMSARLGVITGKGLSALIRESLGVRLSVIILGILLFANLANTVSEFAGVAASMEIFGVSKFISVPIAAILVWFVAIKFDYKSVERLFLVASAIYITYVISGIMAKPDWNEVLTATVSPSFHFDSSYVTLAVTIVGTTIAPWMQFYQQSSIADKALKAKDYVYEQIDVVVGSIFAVLVAAFITIACASTLYKANLHIETAQDAAMALGPLAGEYAKILFGLGLLNASVFSASILPLSTAYVVCEAFGWESGLNNSWKEAPIFFGIYTALIVLGAAIILLPVRSLVEMMLASQTLNGVLLPVILVVMLRLINDKRIMGKFVNGRIMNIFSWVTVIALTGLTTIMILTTLFPGLFG
ncbi:MAG: Nramp family divalent metal transporter [Anaerolineae bacterium]|nr:Nramp family divalent metal transporter [Anaerolineae bacterium]